MLPTGSSSQGFSGNTSLSKRFNQVAPDFEDPGLFLARRLRLSIENGAISLYRAAGRFNPRGISPSGPESVAGSCLSPDIIGGQEERRSRFHPKRGIAMTGFEREHRTRCL